ncbi:Outer membrane protein assembly factor YaeT precursor [Fulvivirga imtechensis AK7]|uniref:Outer membrane protein assembly factor YaeT n=1 Tax=Fulvivirga imtechensis AK7 TaxID=1237149 RepID=L8JQY1_9BACT|nr:POTRA domain-containing protein [Fulvivirga imtechensis]ELR71381.1 Outer membrane protein assembly factor YaeT precursor [Fulvivirga imtechensis AK7]
MKRILFFLVFCFIVAGSANGQFRKRTNTQDDESGLNYSNPQEYVIAGIEVTGLKVLDKNALISLSGLKVGDEVSVPGDEISGAIRKLWKHGLVGDVSIAIDKIEGDQIYLNIILSERPRLTGFTFEGVKKSRETEIREDLNLIRGRILSDAIIRNTEITVKNSYVKKGYLNAEVNVIQQQDSLNSDGVKLKIVVNPRSKVKVNKIRIEGNEEFADNRIKKKMKSTNEHVRFSLFKRAAELVMGINPSNVVSFVDSSYEMSGSELKEFVTDNIKLNFFKSSKFIKSDYEDDKIKIIEFYNSKGYRDAEIISDTIYAYSDNSVNIDIKVDEGKKYYFRNIIWTGNFVHTAATLDKILGIEKGDVYNKELIDQKLTFNPKGPDISGLYMDDGYLFFRVNPVEVAVEGDSIDVEMRIYEGDQATIKNVIIAGNERTRDHVIRRELRTIPGQKFSRTDIIRTQQQLSQLGYFDPQQISPTPLPNPADGTVDIEWKVVERSSDQIELSGGWGGQFGFVGTLGLVLNNFSLRNMIKGKFTPIPVGDGQRLSIRAQANGRQFQSYSFSFTEPWLGGKKPNSLSVSLNYSVQRARVANSDGTFPRFGDYNASLRLKGITVGLGRRLEWPDNYFTLTNSLSYLVYELDNYGTRGLGFSDGNANSITFNTTLARNSIDNPMYPTAGSSISLNVSLTPPYSLWRGLDYDNISNAERYKWIEYHKWMFDASYYINLVGKLVLETRGHFGFIGSYSKEAGIGPFERFYLGGDGLAGQNFLLGTEIIGLRGYENNSITPPYDALGASDIRGGIAYNKFVMELRYPVTTGQAATIYGFVFAEAGNNFHTFEDFNPFENYRSAGFGARIFMPAFGLIGVNWGYGFDTLPGRSERSGAQFHFTIGQQIR